MDYRQTNTTAIYSATLANKSNESFSYKIVRCAKFTSRLVCWYPDVAADYCAKVNGGVENDVCVEAWDYICIAE